MTDHRHDPLAEPLRAVLGDLGDETDPAVDWTAMPVPGATGPVAGGGRARLAVAAAVVLLLAGLGAVVWATAGDDDGVVSSPGSVPPTTEPAATTTSDAVAPTDPPTTEPAPSTVASPAPPLTVAPTTTSTSTVDPTTTSPSAAPSIRTVVGRSAVGEAGCSASSCAFVAVEAAGLDPNTAYQVDCFSEERGKFDTGTSSVTTDDAGAFAGDLSCYFGYPGDRVFVTLGPYRADAVTWPAG